MREAGYTKREIAEKLGLEKSQIKNWIARENRRKRKAVNGEPLRRKGRPMKETTEAELERLRMENKLLRDFLQFTGLSQILCKHRNAVQIEQNLFKAEVAQAAAALFSK